MELHVSTIYGAIGFLVTNPSLRPALHLVLRWISARPLRISLRTAISLALVLALGYAPLGAQVVPMRVPRSTRPPGGKANPKADEGQGLLAKFEGTLRSKTTKQLILELEGEQTLTFRVTRKTTFLSGKDKIKPETVEVGSKVMLEATREPNGDLSAVNVFTVPPKK